MKLSIYIRHIVSDGTVDGGGHFHGCHFTLMEVHKKHLKYLSKTHISESSHSEILNQWVWNGAQESAFSISTSGDSDLI